MSTPSPGPKSSRDDSCALVSYRGVFTAAHEFISALKLEYSGVRRKLFMNMTSPGRTEYLSRARVYVRVGSGDSNCACMHVHASITKIYQR